MNGEYGRAYSVEERWAGANLEGDHLSTATTLDVIFGWDFDEEGGQCEVDGLTLTYTSATFPPDDDDEVPVVLHLDGTLGADVADGAFVRVLPGGVSKQATVEVTGQGEPIVADVDHALFDKIADGIRGDAYEAPTVLVVQEGSSWRVVNIVGQEPVVDGSYLDPDTMPPGPPPVPVAPASSPTPVLSALGIGSLRIAWTPITNATTVMYDVYLSDTSPVVVSPANLLESTAASMVSTGTLPDGTELVAGTTYYAAIQTRSEDQMGPVSSEGSGTPVQVTGPDIAASAVNAEHISANSIDGDKLTGTVILGSDITTAEEGERHGLSAAEGHYSYGPDGEQVFSAKGGNVSVTGDITAVSLNVTDGATWAGENIGAPSASTMMASGIQAPGSPPTVEWGYDEITLDGGDVVGDDQSKRCGLVWHNSHWWVASSISGTQCLVEFDSSGNFVARHDGSGSGGPSSLTMLGSTFYVATLYGLNGAISSKLKRFDSSGTYLSSLVADEEPVRSLITWGSDGTNLLRTWREPGESMRWQKYDTNGNKVGGEVNSGENTTPNAILGGTFDFGAQRIIVAGPNTAQVYTTSGGNLSNAYDFPSENTRGMAWRDGAPGHFYGLHSPRKIRIHTNEFTGEGQLPEFHVAATWVKSLPANYETLASRTGLRSFAQRAKHTLRLPVPLPGQGGAGDPDGVNFYAGRSKQRTKLQIQASVQALSPGDFAVAAGITDTFIPDGTDDALDPPPASGNFPDADPYEHFSQAVIPGTSDPQTSLKGDGSAVLHGLKVPFASYYRANGLTIPDGLSPTQPAVGTVVEEHPFITYTSGGTWTSRDAGLIRCHAHASFDPASDSGFRELTLFVNGVEKIRDRTSGGAATDVDVDKELRLSPGDAITLGLAQNSGGNLGIQPGEGRFFITFKRIGA